MHEIRRGTMERIPKQDAIWDGPWRCSSTEVPKVGKEILNGMNMDVYNINYNADSGRRVKRIWWTNEQCREGENREEVESVIGAS